MNNYCLITIVEWICWLNGQRKKAPTPEVKAVDVYINFWIMARLDDMILLTMIFHRIFVNGLICAE